MVNTKTIPLKSLTPKLDIWQIDPIIVEKAAKQPVETFKIIVDENNSILAGHGVYYVAEKLNQSDIEVEVIESLSEEEKKNYWVKEAQKLELDDILFPSNNEFGIPTLDINNQADCITLPCLKWGRISRRAKKEVNTIHFFTDDYKFTRIWKNPEQVVEMRPKYVVELDFTTSEETPLALFLGALYQKRWLARFWQACGIRIWVDLNVQPRFHEYNLLGIPKGWRSYATRFVKTLPDGTYSGIEGLEADFKVATKHAAPNKPLFAVFGGRDKVEKVCADRGWLWMPEHAATITEAKYGAR